MSSIPTINSPIGVFDSGVGGLSVYLHLRQQLPHERYLYYADTKHVPYGNRTAQDISHLTLTAIDWLIQKGCKLVVVACNSASAHALSQARLQYPHIPIVGLVPALKPALLYVQANPAISSKHVAILATMATLKGQSLENIIKEFAMPQSITVSKWYEPTLVPWVEAGMPKADKTTERLRELLTLFAKEKVQAIVLGCTHYPFFREFLMAEMACQGYEMALFDSGDAIARRVKQLLKEQQLLKNPNDCWPALYPCKRNNLQFFATAKTTRLTGLVKQLSGAVVQVQQITY